MKLPEKIRIIDSTQSTETRLRFGEWEGYDKGQQLRHMANIINEILDYLYTLPQIPNEIPTLLKKEGDNVVHEHMWKMSMRLGTKGFFECRDCGETQERYIPTNLA